MRSETGPTVLFAGAACSMNHCICEAARHARAAWPSPSNRRSSASPRNLRTSPPWRDAIPIRPSKHPLTTRISSSAPALPFCASRSASAVNPERSTATSVASSSRYGIPAGQERASAGKYGAYRAAARGLRERWLGHGEHAEAREDRRRLCRSVGLVEYAPALMRRQRDLEGRVGFPGDRQTLVECPACRFDVSELCMRDADDAMQQRFNRGKAACFTCRVERRRRARERRARTSTQCVELGKPRLRLDHEHCAHVAEAPECVLEEVLRLVEAPRTRRGASQVATGDVRRQLVAGRVGDMHRLAEELLCLVEPSLIGEDLADVVRLDRNLRHVPGTSPQLTAPLVQLERLVPPTFVVRLDPEIVEYARLPREIAELFVDR